MGCKIEYDNRLLPDEDVLFFGREFASRCDGEIPEEHFLLKLESEDSCGWIGYLYGFGNYGKETVGMIGRGCYHWEDTYFLSDDVFAVLEDAVVGFAAAISDDGTAYNLHT